MSPRIFNLFVLILLYLSEGICTDLSAQDFCDSSLNEGADGPLSYSNRGDRCEGVYIKPVGATTLWIASFTESFEDYKIDLNKPLLVEWDKPPADNIIRLRAEGTRRRLYYRMDTYRQPGSTSFLWPTDVLSSLNILKNDIGVVCLMQYASSQQIKDIYLPVRIKQAGKSIAKKNLSLVLVPGVELSEVYISVALTGTDGVPDKFIIDGKKLGYGYYPADRSIQIPVGGLNKTGLYYQEISASLKAGGTATIELWFYYSNK